MKEQHAQTPPGRRPKPYLWLALAVWTLSGIPAALFAQDQDPPAEAPADGPAFMISEVTYRIEGRTRRWVLEDLLDLEPGRSFASEEELLAHLAQQQQQLVNQRSLQSALVTASYPDGDMVGGEAVLVDVLVETEDTWNVIVLPYARYDSNTGLLLSLRGRDYNFFGTLTELELNFDYERTDEEQDLFTISSQFSVPFRMLERRWRLIMDQNLEIEGDEFDFDLGLGLGYMVELFGIDWEAVYEQRYRYITNDELGDGSFLTSRVSLASGIGTGLLLGPFGELEYQPELYAETNYRPGGSISDARRGVTVGFDQGLAAGGFDWIGNYRRGLRLRLQNENAWNVTRDRWDTEVNAQVAAFLPLWQPDPTEWPKAGISAALGGFYLINGAEDDQDDAAADARGILNDRMQGDVAAFLNLDALVTVWTLEPIFEAQFGVFLDTAFVRDTRGTFGSSALDLERDLRFGSGIEVIGFPLFARSLYVRGSLGFDLRTMIDGASPLSSDAREIFIGLGHHY